MCSSESEADLSHTMSGPAMGTRKRSRGDSLINSDSQTELEDEADIQEKYGDESGMSEDDRHLALDSDDDFVVDKKKKKTRLSKIIDKTKKSLNNSKTSLGEISTPNVNDLTASKLPAIPISKPMVTITSDEVFNFMDGKNFDYNCNLDLDMSVTIATPEQINNRSFDQEQFITPSSTPMAEWQQEFITHSSTPMMERQEVDSTDKIVQRMASQVVKSLQSTPPVSQFPPPSSEGEVTPAPEVPSISEWSDKTHWQAGEEDQRVDSTKLGSKGNKEEVSMFGHLLRELSKKKTAAGSDCVIIWGFNSVQIDQKQWLANNATAYEIFLFFLVSLKIKWRLICLFFQILYLNIFISTSDQASARNVHL